jgi:predicted nucleotidyltransferase component of viral defense system
MIDKRELLDEAAALSLLPHVVEKDYALGWALAGIYAHSDLKDSWIFKGGTCLKKCFFETYRFSEDLDFTLTDPGQLDAGFLKRVFGEVSEWIYEATGLEFPAALQAFDLYKNPRGNLSCQGKLSYAGPLAPPRSGGLPRVKLDLTADEHVALDPVRATIYHPYSDAPAAGIQVLAYAYEEAFAEKVRALAERARPRDLYDVVNLFRNEDARPAANVLLDVLRSAEVPYERRPLQPPDVPFLVVAQVEGLVECHVQLIEASSLPQKAEGFVHVFLPVRG